MLCTCDRRCGTPRRWICFRFLQTHCVRALLCYLGRYIGALQVTVDTTRGGIVTQNGQPMVSGSPLMLGGNVSASTAAEDPVMSDLVSLYSANVDAYNSQVIGKLP